MNYWLVRANWGENNKTAQFIQNTKCENNTKIYKVTNATP